MYVPTGGGDLRDASFYGEAIVARRHLEKAAGSLGYVLRVIEGDDDLPQSFVVLQKIASR